MLLSRRPQARALQQGANSTRSPLATGLRQRRCCVPLQLHNLRQNTLLRRPRRAVVVAGLLGGGGPRKPLSGPLRNGQSFSLEGIVWTAYEDPTSGVTYFYNTISGVTQWADPRPDVSEVQMAQPYAVDRSQVQQKMSAGVAPRAPPQLSENNVKVLAGGGIVIGLFVLYKFGRIIFGRRQQPEDEYFPLGISESMNEDIMGTADQPGEGFRIPPEATQAAADATPPYTGLAYDEPPTVEEFFLPGSGAALGLTSQDLETSRTATWDDNLSTIDDIEPPGPDSEELPTTEEFFLPGSGASRGLTSLDLEASRTATWDDNNMTIDDAEPPGPDSEELPTTEEFFLPGSGASRGLTSLDLETSRTATWDDNTVTIDDLEPPGPDSEELPYTEEFFLPGSGASRGLTSSDLELSRTATWDDNVTTLDESEEDDEGGATQVLPPPAFGGIGGDSIFASPSEPIQLDLSLQPGFEEDSSGGPSTMDIAEAASVATREVERLRERLDQEYEAALTPAKASPPADEAAALEGEGEAEGKAEPISLGKELVDGAITDQEAASWDQEAQAFVEELTDMPQLDDSAGYADEEEATLLSDDGLLEEDQEVMLDDAALLAERLLVDSEGTQIKRRKPQLLEEAIRAEYSGQEVALRCAAYMVPHPDKIEEGGEDAFFISTYGYGAAGIADGVGSCILDGINPADFARQLVSNLQTALGVVDWQESEEGLREVLKAAHNSATALGSATVIVAAGGPGGIVHVANLGDCGVRVIRDGKCTFATTDMLHRYNTPFQLACWPQTEEEEEEEESDFSDDADLYDIEVSPGDILVLASDGLFDNVFDEEVASIVSSIIDDELSAASAERAASALTAAATAKVRNLRSRTPWVEAAARAGKLPPLQRLRPRGGKMDDITVVVALVTAP